jgi:hypothetical protein
MHARGMIERYRDDQSGDCSTKRDYVCLVRIRCRGAVSGHRVIVGRSAYRPWRSAPGSPVVICIRQIVWLAIVFASRESTR